jgi:hypothetical protein
MFGAMRHMLRNRKVVTGLLLAITALVVYLVFFRTLTMSPTAESNQMQQLEQTKTTHQIAPFVSDGCSGNVSKNWRIVIEQMSKTSQSFAETFAGAENIPFEYACIKHDQVYHSGEGGYVGRLQADLQLRSEIISYGIEHAATIQTRTGLKEAEEAIFLYELLAEAIYRGVRLGGAPCTGEPYAWGYGYGAGKCE